MAVSRERPTQVIFLGLYHTPDLADSSGEPKHQLTSQDYKSVKPTLLVSAAGPVTIYDASCVTRAREP